MQQLREMLPEALVYKSKISKKMKSDRAGILIIFAKLEEDVIDNFADVTDKIQDHLLKME